MSCTSKFIIGDSSPAAVMDFQVGGINFPHRVNQFSSSIGENTQSNNNLPVMNLDPLGFGSSFQELGFTYSNLHHNTTLTSSIQTLSSLNQDLHWKLQQQRLGMLFGGGGGSGSGENNHQRQQQKESGLQPILFQNLETSRKEVGSSGDCGGVGGLATEWFFDNHYAPVNMNPPPAGDDQSGEINNWNGIQVWNNMNQYQM
ncbi:hypothetical protein L1987_68535 [Smallanthus sonchifolius]|uniref:Uncharacterized protein n=1 Tax=Smallanthus sonchifolius TaxID=185202 RepID=A0ACB9B4K8_9ASTR|nr:hypothetical protein L1987_68535 [Smallanthus sonchifolius]